MRTLFQKSLVLLALTALGVGGVAYYSGTQSASKSESVLRVVYPVRSLLQENRLFDPTNLFSVYHYYLLENLASGLVADSSDSAVGYRGVLAESWRQETDRTWSFRLRSNLKWSDGSPLTGDFIQSFIRDLSKKRSRHLIVLPKLESIEWVAKENRLVLRFSQPTNSSLLHELSLADASVLHPTNTSSGWEVTSGPYCVVSYNVKEKHLQLLANPHHPDAKPEIPQAVDLFQSATKDTTLGEEHADLWVIGSPSFSAQNRKRISGAPQVKEGAPAAIYYFDFNPIHPMAKNIRARREFSALVQHYFQKSVPPMVEAQSELQFAAPGYPSRLEIKSQRLPFPIETSALKGAKVRISMYRFAKEFPWMSQDFERFLVSAGLEPEFSYGRFGEPDSAEDFARADLFLGNQKDSVGSWSYLYSHPDSELGAFLPLVKTDLEQSIQTSVNSEKESLLQRVHSTTLREALVVPFLVERRYAIHSKRISLDLWNPFDMRVRLYDIRWK